MTKLLVNSGGHKSICGFVPSVLSPPSIDTPLQQGDKAPPDIGRNPRLFLISKQGISSRKKKTRNRKPISYSSIISHNDKSYQVNASKVGNQGIFTQILHKGIDQLEYAESKWKRVFVLFFNLHHKDYHTQNNKHISRFRKNLARRLEREYEINEVGYLWVREQERAKAQHYHFLLFLEGNKIRHSSKILRIVEATWKNISASNHVPTLKNPFYFMDSEEIKANVIYRMSYLAKTRGKGYRDKQVKDYSTSRLN